MVEFFLIADIGGTNSNVALAQLLKKEHKIVFQKRFPTITYSSAENMINNFIDMCADAYDVVPKSAFIGVAGEVDRNSAKLTNLDLRIDAKEIIRSTPLENVNVINDFEAISYSIELIQKKHIKILNKGTPHRNKTYSILGAGTGLGKSIIVCNKGEYIPINSQGGHADFPVGDKEEYDLINFLKESLGKENIVYEDLISGTGIENIYRFLQYQFTGIANGADAHQISENRKKDPIARKTFKYFYRFYARAAKNFVLESHSLNGIYLAGGIITKNMDISKKDFMYEFTNSEKFERILREVPIYIIRDYDVSLLGLINYIYKNIKE